MTKKIILLLVEGLTDEEALALVFSKLAKEHDIEFDVLHTDITADENMTVKYIGERIKREIADYLRKNPFKKKRYIKSGSNYRYGWCICSNIFGQAVNIRKNRIF